ncbi:MAG: PhnD/SsuA/transferrin family substrate-binding protein [Egibacteraceae bacterium]
MGRQWRTLWLAVLMLTVATVATVACTGTATASEARVVRLAVTDLQGLEELQREFGAFKTQIEQVTGFAVEFFPVPNRVAATAALETDQVDLVFTGPAEYVVMRARTEVQPVVAVRRPGYHSCIYTSAGSGITTLDQLAGQKIGMSDVGSTSGHLGPSQMLLDAGIDPLSDLQVLTLGDAVHAALERGDIAAVGVGCHDFQEYTGGDRDAFPILAEGPPLPPDVVIARPDLDPEVVERIRTGFEENWPALLRAMLEGQDNQKYSDAELVIPTDSDYDVVRSMYEAIGVDDFTEFID